MTSENQKKRDFLKSIEVQITTALAHQPEEDEHCQEFLDKTIRDVRGEMDDFCIAGGNEAVIRNEMEEIVYFLEAWKDLFEPAIKVVAERFIKSARAALAAPTRNCNMFKSRSAAQEAFESQYTEKERENMKRYPIATLDAFCDWLFATTKEGGAE